MEADPELNLCPASEIISALQNIVSAQLYTGLLRHVRNNISIDWFSWRVRK
jgi:hypothetical protein